MKKTSFVLFVLFLLFGASFTYAQNTDLNIDVSAETSPPPPRPARPLDLLREKNQQVKQIGQNQKIELQAERKQVIENAVDVRMGNKDERRTFMENTIQVRQDMHAELRVQLDAAATPEEKQAVLRSARNERMQFRTQVKTDAQTMRDGFRTEWQGVRADARALVAEHFFMVMNRLVKALERFDDILARIDSRIQKLQTDGVDVSAAVSASAAASAAIGAADLAAADAKAAIEAAASSDAPREHIEEVRAAVRAAVDAVKAAHEALKETLRILKSLVPPQNTDIESSTDVEAQAEIEISE